MTSKSYPIRSHRDFAFHIRRTRLARGMTQVELAERCASYPRAIIDAEKGRGLSFELALRISSALDLPLFLESDV